MEGKGLIEWIKETNPVRCKSEVAWRGRNLTIGHHFSCTLEIARSDALISTNTNEIEDIAKFDQVTFENLVEELWLLFENMTLQQQHDESRDLNKVFTVIDEFRRNREKDIPQIICSLNWTCAKQFRKMVLQLKLIQLG